jgi:hypothetical protein
VRLRVRALIELKLYWPASILANRICRRKASAAQQNLAQGYALLGAISASPLGWVHGFEEFLGTVVSFDIR